MLKALLDLSFMLFSTPSYQLRINPSAATGNLRISSGAGSLEESGSQLISTWRGVKGSGAVQDRSELSTELTSGLKFEIHVVLRPLD